MAISFWGKGFYAEDMDAGTQDFRTVTTTTEATVNRKLIEPVSGLIKNLEKMNAIRPSDDLQKGIRVLGHLNNKVKECVHNMPDTTPKISDEDKSDVIDETPGSRTFRF
tara:strand:- start:1389 stop:1715 length:327 start_codon:yes stop_codon:yes gene_type:complete